MPVIALSIFLVVLAGMLAPAAALETVATFASDCTTPKTVFQLGDTVCAKVDNVAGGDLNNIFLQWVAPSGVVAGSPGTTLVTTSPQTFTLALPTSGFGAERGLWKAQTANVSNSAARVAADFRVPRMGVVGVRRDSNFTSYVTNTNTTGVADGQVVFGQAGDIGLWGDWAGTGRYSAGVYRPSDGTFRIALSNTAPAEDIVFQITGVVGGAPVVGDWTGDGTTKVGVYLDGTVYLRNTLTTGAADTTFNYGIPGDQIVAGDFDGDGISTMAVYREGVFFIRNSNTTGIADLAFAYGVNGDTGVVGDWNASDGISKPGVFRPGEATYYLRNSLNAGAADTVATFGIVGDAPDMTAHNEAPVVVAGGTLNYPEGQAATAIDPGLTATDMDNATLVGATATITGNCQSGQDVLSFATQNGITGNYTPATCLMTLSGSSSVANYQTALRTVKYHNSAVTPNTGARTVSWQVDDGAAANNLSSLVTSGISISCPSVTVNGTIPDLIMNQVMATATFTQGGGNGTIVWSQTGLPPGVDINTSSGDVTGTPTQSGSFSATIKATDANGCFGTKNVTVHVNAPPGINSNNSYSAQIGAALSFAVTTTVPPTGGFPTAAITQAAGGGQTGLPGTVTFNDNGNGTATLGGSVTSGGAANYTTTITANNGVAPNDTQSFTLQITCPAINITRTGGGSFPAATYNFGYPAGNTFTATGNLNTVHWAFAPNGQPPGINLTIAAGSLSGLATGTGNFTMIVVATDQVNGCTGQASFPFTINPRILPDSYSNLVNNTEAVVTGGTTSSPSTPFVPLTGTLVSNDTPAGNVTLAAGSVGTFATSQGGSVTIAADATFKYTPPVTVTALTSDTFNYTATSNFAGPCGSCAPSSGASSASGTATLNLSGRVWYVNPNAGSNGNGQSQSPWNSTANIKQQPTVGGANTSDIIFAYNGPTGNLTANIPLLASQTLWGEGVALVVNTVTLRSAGTAPSLTASSADVVSVNSGNTITGVTLTNSNNDLISGAPAGLTLDTVTMTPSGTANGFNITGGSGTVALTDVTMTGTGSGDVVKVNTGTQSWTFTNSPITQTSGRALNVANKTGGGMTFDATSTVTVSAGTTDGAVTLSSNSGAGNTFGFSKLALTTSGPARALFLGTTGTVNNTDTTSTISATDTNAGPGTIAIDVASTTLGLTFQNVSVTGTNANVVAGIQLVTVNGSLTMNGGSISTNSGRVANIDTGTASVTYAGTISHGGTGIRVINKTGGTVTFSGATKTINTGAAANAVNLTSNTGATISFTGGGLAITTTSAVGFNATGGGTVNVTGTGNTIGSGAGTALNVMSTTIGASGLTFASISSNGGATGIVLDTTGSGGLTVNGGTIQNKTGRGASFISAQNISLKSMNFTGTATSDLDADNSGLTTGDNLTTNAAIHLETVTNATLDTINISGSAEQGINGHNVTNFALKNSSITGAGNAADEDGIHFYNMLGTSEITNTTISGSGDDNINIQNNTNVALPPGMTPVLNLTITGGSANTGVLGSGYLMGIRGTSTATVTIDGVTANNNFSGGIVIDTFDTATSTIEIKNSTSTNNNDGISMSSNNGNTKFDIHDNVSFAGNDFGRINILKAAFSTAGTLQGKIRNNPIDVANGQAADGISVFQAGDGTLTVSITDNTITYQGTQRAILVQGGQDGSGQLNATVRGNDIDMKLDGTGNAATGILAQVAVASPSGDNTNMCADIGGAGTLANVFTHSLGGNMAAGDIRMRQRFVTTISLPGYGGANNNPAAVVTYLAGRNTLVNSPTATATTDAIGGGSNDVPGAGGFVNVASCPQPVFP